MSADAGDAAVGGILLAAGAGTRLGRPKALARFLGEPLPERGARTLRLGGCAPVVVVLGARAAEAAGVLHLGDAAVVRNPRWEEGLGSSLVAGLGALEGRCAAAVVALADQPLVTPAVVARLVAAWKAGARAVVATYDGRPRNPVLLDASLWPQVRAGAVGDAGARGFLRSNPGLVTEVPCEDCGACEDVDTPADLAALEARAAPRAAGDRGTLDMPARGPGAPGAVQRRMAGREPR